MGLAHVRNEIIAESKRAAERIRQEAAKEVAAILTAAQQKVDAHAKELEEKQVPLMERMTQQELAAARFEAKKLLLNRRKELLDAVFAEVCERLRQLPDSARERMLSTLLDRAKQEIPVHTVYTNAGDARLLSKHRGIVVKPASMLGGLITENADGTIRVDYSFDQLLAQLREQELATIAKELF